MTREEVKDQMHKLSAQIGKMRMERQILGFNGPTIKEIGKLEIEFARLSKEYKKLCLNQ